MALKILGGNVSPFVRKTRAFCAEKGIPYTLEQISPFAPPPGWREISPLGRIPAAEHDGRIINDSSVTCGITCTVAPRYLPSRSFWITRSYTRPAVRLFWRDSWACVKRS